MSKKYKVYSLKMHEKAPGGKKKIRYRTIRNRQFIENTKISSFENARECTLLLFFYRLYVLSECGLRSNCGCKTARPCLHDLSPNARFCKPNAAPNESQTQRQASPGKAPRLTRPKCRFLERITDQAKLFFCSFSKRDTQ